MSSISPTSKKLFFFFSLLLLLSFLLAPAATTSSIPSRLPREEPTTDDRDEEYYNHQVFRVKRTKTFFLDYGGDHPMTNKYYTGNGGDHRRRRIKNFKTRPNFSVMLPKGFVPPSGSSPCHNDEPNSRRVAAYCDFSSRKP